jgi:hypothetical protein
MHNTTVFKTLKAVYVQGSWAWTDGSAWDFSNWGSDQPDDFNGDEDCVDFSLIDGAKWYDVACGLGRTFVCKI